MVKPCYFRVVYTKRRRHELVYNPVISGWCIPRYYIHKQKNKVYNPVISGWCIPRSRDILYLTKVYNPVISGWCIPFFMAAFTSCRVYNPVISGWCIPAEEKEVGDFQVYNPVISGWCIPSTGIQFPESAGRHLSHNKPANRVFLLPRRPCISTGVNSGYTVRTRFYFLGNVCNHCTLYLLATGL